MVQRSKRRLRSLAGSLGSLVASINGCSSMNGASAYLDFALLAAVALGMRMTKLLSSSRVPALVFSWARYTIRWYFPSFVAPTATFSLSLESVVSSSNFHSLPFHPPRILMGSASISAKRLRMPLEDFQLSSFSENRSEEIAEAGPAPSRFQRPSLVRRSIMPISCATLNSRLFQSAMYSSYSAWVSPSFS